MFASDIMVDKQMLTLSLLALVAASSGLDSAVMSGESDDDESSAVMLGDVPLEVIQSILQALDPLSLSAAACVCRWERMWS